jgi:hypothetical protein
MDKYEIKLSHAREHLADMGKSLESPSQFTRHFAGFLASAGAIVPFAAKESEDKGKKTELKALADSYSYIKAFRKVRGTDLHEEPVIPEQHAVDFEFDIVVSKAGSEIDHSRWQEPGFDPWGEVELVETKPYKRIEYQLNETDLSQYGLTNDFSLIGHCAGYLQQLEMMLLAARGKGFIE